MQSQTLHHQKIISTLHSIKGREYIDPNEYREFEEFLHSPLVLRDEGVTKHSCAACFIINVKEKKIFLGDHVKSGRWLNGVGGHMDPNESPEETARREFQEELSYTPAPNQQFELCDIVHFANIGRPECSDHYDFLFLVRFNDLPNFDYDKKEFKVARWIGFDESLTLNTYPVFKQKLAQMYHRISA